MALAKYFSDKRILVTGGCGTVGSELVRQLLLQHPKELRVLDNNEDGVFGLEQQLGHYSNLVVVIGDIREESRVHDVTEGVDIIFHTAALKHVQICERSPSDAVMTNIVGTQNVIRAALHHGVRKCLFTSTDKAVSPTNVMGTSKLMAERLMTAANNYSRNDSLVLASTRFGNVLASRGSVVRIFYEQIKNGGPVTITDPSMTRFIMTVDESVRLILATALLAKGGEVLVPKMPIIRVIDLAGAMIDLIAPKYSQDPSSIPIKVIGPRLGERLYEELMTVEESARALELEDLFSILPARGSLRRDIQYAYPGTVNASKVQGYDTSNGPFMSREEIKDYLCRTAVLDFLDRSNGNGDVTT